MADLAILDDALVLVFGISGDRHRLCLRRHAEVHRKGRTPDVLALYQKRSGAAHVVEVAEAAPPERF